MTQFLCGTNPLHVLGAVISIKLTNGESMVGEVFCYETCGSNTIVLKEQADMDHATFRIVKIQNICELTALSPPHPGDSLDASFPNCSKGQLEERERAAVTQFLQNRHTFGVNVTQDAQDIFDFIHKTHPDCCWVDGSRIQVMGITVSPPYGPENCEGKGRALERIQQVLERFIQRRKANRTKLNAVQSAVPPVAQLSAWPVSEQPFVPQFYTLPHGSNPVGYATTQNQSTSALPPHQPVALAPATFMGGEDGANGSQSIATAYAPAGPGGQPVMFPNSAAGNVPTALGEPGNLMMMQQGANGLMLIVLHAPEDRMAAGDHAMIPAGSVTQSVPGHPERPVYAPVVFANPNGTNPMLTAAGPPGASPGTMSIAADPAGNPVFVPMHVHGAGVQLVADMSRLTVSENMASPMPVATPLQRRGPGNAGPGSAAVPSQGPGAAANAPPVTLAHGITPTTTTTSEGGPGGSSHHASLPLPHPAPFVPATAGDSLSGPSSATTSATGTSSVPESRPSSSPYQRRVPTSTVSQGGIPVSPSGPSPAGSTNQFTAHTQQQQHQAYAHQQSGASNGRGNGDLHPSGSSTEAGSMCPLTPLSPQLAQHTPPVPSQGISSTLGTYNGNHQQPIHHHQHHHHQRYQRIGSNGSLSLQDTQGTSTSTGRPRWNSSARPQGNQGSALSGITGITSSKGQQQFRQNVAYGLHDETLSRPSSSGEAGAPSATTTGLSSGSTPTGGLNHHHASHSSGVNGGGHSSNYRGMTGGKGNRSQRNRGGGRRRD